MDYKKGGFRHTHKNYKIPSDTKKILLEQILKEKKNLKKFLIEIENNLY
jgi:hypothetical protein